MDCMYVSVYVVCVFMHVSTVRISPSAPWQMSVLEAFSIMNCGLEHNSLKRNKHFKMTVKREWNYLIWVLESLIYLLICICQTHFPTSQEQNISSARTHRWPFPGDAPHFVRIWAEFIVTQRWRQSLETVILEKHSSLQTAFPQRFKILVQVFLSMAVGSNPIGSVSVVLKFTGNSRHIEALQAGEC